MGSDTADPYLTWQDLLEEEEEADATSAAVAADPDPPVADPWSASGQITLPTDVEALMAEKDRLESELRRLSGVGDPPPEDERIRRMYPVKVHTKDSRIEERRLRRHDDHQRLLKQRALEAKLSTAREECRQAELAAERRRRASERALARARAGARQAEAEAERRRKAIERAQAVAREQARQAEYAAEQERRAVEAAAVQRRWEQDRQKALQRSAQDRRQQVMWQEQVLDEQRAGAIQRARAKRSEEQADLVRKPREGLSDRGEPRKDEAKRAGSNDPMERSCWWSDDARSDPRRDFAQRRSQALAWEEQHERSRQQANARRREEQIVAERLDRRGKRSG
jgi:hypothetical protein